MTGIIFFGCLAGLGVAMIVWRLAPAQPHLGWALDRLDPDRTTTTGFEATHTHPAIQDRLGAWVQRRLPVANWVTAPTSDLAVMRISTARWLGDKALYFLIGLLFPTIFTVLLAAVGVTLPIVLPAVAGLALGVGLSFIPDIDVRRNAKTARLEFRRAMAAYIDLVALERQAGAGTTQALEQAAAVGDSWVFVRLREELARARWSGIAPWDGLTHLANELQLGELHDLADIMRLSGEEGAGVYTSLRARSASLRNALLAEEHTKANEAGEQMTMPVSLLAIIFLALLGMPAVLRVALG